MGHDHQELLKADLLNCALTILPVVSGEMGGNNEKDLNLLS